VGSSSAWRVIEGELQPWVQVFLFSRGEVYLTPTGKSSANVSLLGAPEFVSSLLPTEALSNWLVQHREKLGASFELESPALGAGPLNSFRLGAVLSGALLVGDACETFDPIGGMGMSHAVESGRLAAAAVVRGLTTGGFSEAAQWYESAQRSMAQEMRGFTRMTSWMLGTASGRVLMPWAVASGIAQRLSSAAHGAGKALPCRWLLGLAGAAA
jgi:flavin-dependent dehydrogenase